MTRRSFVPLMAAGMFGTAARILAGTSRTRAHPEPHPQIICLWNEKEGVSARDTLIAIGIPRPCIVSTSKASDLRKFLRPGKPQLLIVGTRFLALATANIVNDPTIIFGVRNWDDFELQSGRIVSAFSGHFPECPLETLRHRAA